MQAEVIDMGEVKSSRECSARRRGTSDQGSVGADKKIWECKK